MTEEEFGDLYTRLHPFIFRHARASLGSDDSALDVVSDTFQILWEKRHDIGGQATSVAGYVVGIGRIVTLRHATAKQKRTAHESDLNDELSPVLDDVADGVITKHRGHSIVRQLTPSDQRLVEVMTTPDLSAAEAADMLDLTKGAYAVRVHRVRKRIEHLERQYEQATSGGATL